MEAEGTELAKRIKYVKEILSGDKPEKEIKVIKEETKEVGNLYYKTEA